MSPKRDRPQRPIPRGVEVLVKKAAVDPAFRERLLADPVAAAREIGLTLDPTERQMLEAIPPEQLETTIAWTTVCPRQRAAFLGTAAGVMLAALTGCPDPSPPCTGIAPDYPPPQEEPAEPDEDPSAPVGATAEQPVAPVDSAQSPAKREPTDEPPVEEPTRGIRPDRPGD